MSVGHPGRFPKLLSFFDLKLSTWHIVAHRGTTLQVSKRFQKAITVITVTSDCDSHEIHWHQTRWTCHCCWTFCIRHHYVYWIILIQPWIQPWIRGIWRWSPVAVAPTRPWCAAACEVDGHGPRVSAAGCLWPWLLPCCHFKPLSPNWRCFLDLFGVLFLWVIQTSQPKNPSSPRAPRGQFLSPRSKSSTAISLERWWTSLTVKQTCSTGVARRSPLQARLDKAGRNVLICALLLTTVIYTYTNNI